ncbi:MAG TPA: hypothetical protein VK866_15440, partial [Acidimicrobiales bacterium]|nr:hypothetical protein [Acidimicrobiales bacterium]
ERTWRHSVAPAPDQPGPLSGALADVATIVGIDVAAAREEVGARVEVEWSAPPPDDPETAVLVRRVAEEMIATAVHHAEAATIRVTLDDGDVVVAVDATGVDGAPVVPGLGIGVDTGTGRVVVDGPGQVRIRRGS